MPSFDPAAEFDPLDYHVIADTVVSALLQKPMMGMPITTAFSGAGVYLIYYAGRFEPYCPISGTETPIYVGKAIPRGGRRGTSALRQIERTNDPALFSRLRDHSQSIEAATNLALADFTCRYLVVTQIWIGIAESLLIERFRPVWNAAVDGFGLHDPGTTRRNQRRSDWDTLHEGRSWAPKMQPGKPVDEILAAIQGHFGRD